MHLVQLKSSEIKALIPPKCYPISKWFPWGFVLRMNPYPSNLAMERSGCLIQQLSRHHRCLLQPYNDELMALRFALGKTWAINTKTDKSTYVAYTRLCVTVGSKARSWIGLPCRFGVYPNPGQGLQPSTLVLGWTCEKRQLYSNLARPGSKDDALVYKKLQDCRWLGGTSSKTLSLLLCSRFFLGIGLWLNKITPGKPVHTIFLFLLLQSCQN